MRCASSRHPGIEDFLGATWTSKVAGTRRGHHRLQNGQKMSGWRGRTIAEAVNQARPARLAHPREDAGGNREAP